MKAETDSMTDVLNPEKLPQHVGIIMDGNGRWAISNGMERVQGHHKGAEVVEDITEYARELGVRYLTLYAFSKENWNRPEEEIHALMELLFDFLYSKKDKMIKNQIRLNAIGDLGNLPGRVVKRLYDTIEATSGGNQMVLNLALSYGARDEILRAFQLMLSDVKTLDELEKLKEQLTEDFIANHLDTKDIPAPDLIIRTSGEYRISNFLLWQGAYAELAFVNENWPAFTKEHFYQCLVEYQKRERRFGKTSQQLD